MPLPLISLVLAALLAVPAVAQKRVGAKKEASFTEAVEMAAKAYDAGEYGTAVTALQAAIQAAQKKQRVGILEALPKPTGWKFQDEKEEAQAANPFAAGMSALGLNVQRRYRKDGGGRMNVDVTANSPMVQMISMMFANPAIITAEGGELIEYGVHKAILKKQGDDGLELTILMYDKHIVKVDANGISDEELFAVFDQAFVDRIEKQLGK